MNNQDTRSIQQQLIEYLDQHADVYEEFDATTDLIEQDILDSLLVTDLVLFMQNRFGIEMTARDISPENLSSIDRMAQLVREKQQKARRAA